MHLYIHYRSYYYTTGSNSGAGTAYSSWSSKFTPWFLLGLFGHYLICCVVFYRSLFVPLLAISLSLFWPFHCLSFGHFIVYLLAISLSIFWPFLCLSFGHFIVYFWPFHCLSFGHFFVYPFLIVGI